LCLRYTLTGFERNYQVKILSKQIIGVIILLLLLLLFYPEVNTTFLALAATPTPVVTSTNSDLDKLAILKENQGKSGMSWFFTGLIDGEGCFTIGISRI
jgi:hypothetical protein